MARRFESINKYVAISADYLSIAAALGFTIAQVFNLRPSEQSLPVFVLFTAMVLIIVASCVVILWRHRRAARGAGVAGDAAHEARARRLAAAGLVLSPPIYVVLALFFHIPNAWPILVRAGATPRAADARLAVLRDRWLLDLDEEVGPLFVPGEGLAADRSAIRWITIYNRSTAPSPPLELRIALQPQPGASDPVARVFAVAVATPAERPWLPFGGGPSSPHWLVYNHGCGPGLQDVGWCFAHPPDDRRNWLEPAIRLPLILPRDSVQVYLEFAVQEVAPMRSIPATLSLRQTGPGGFQVNLRRTFDLNAGLSGR